MERFKVQTEGASTNGWDYIDSEKIWNKVKSKILQSSVYNAQKIYTLFPVFVRYVLSAESAQN